MLLSLIDNQEWKESQNEVMEELDSFLCEMYETKPKEIDELLIKLSAIIDKGHFSKHTADIAISKMKPVLLIHNTSVFGGTLSEYMKELSLNEKTCSELVYRAYDKAKDKALEYGYTAPPLKEVNEFDIYTAFAMVIADYWYCMGDLDKFAMLVYQWLSDIDAKDTKTWDYLMS